MDFSLGDDQQSLRDLARKILEERATHERLKQVEAGAERLDRALWQELARANLLGIAVPEAYGGSGLGLVELGLLLHEVGRAVAPLPVWASLVLGGLPLARFGSEEQKRRLLPGLAAGERLLSAALTERGGDDVARPATHARRDGDAFVLAGEKICVPLGAHAERILVPARTGEGALGVFLLDPRARGVTLTAQETTSREIQWHMALDGARVAAADVLGDPAAGAEMLRWLEERAVAGLCALQVGVSERALEITARYTTEREQFGHPIASFQAVGQRAADAYIDVEAMRLTTLQALWRLAAELPAAEEVAVAKFWAAEGGHLVGYAAQHLHGGIGVDVDYPIHRYTLWSKQIELTLGSASRQLAKLGAALAEAPAPLGA